MKEVEKKDRPGIAGGQTGTTNVGVVVTPPATPTFPGGPIIPGPTDPTDPLGDAKQRQQQS